MLIGVTSQNFRTITGHAGKARRFLVFKADSEGQWVEADRIDLPKDMSMHEFRGEQHPVDNLDVLITGGSGEGFIQKMASRGVKVLVTSEVDPQTAVSILARGGSLPSPEPRQH